MTRHGFVINKTTDERITSSLMPALSLFSVAPLSLPLGPFVEIDVILVLGESGPLAVPRTFRVPMSRRFPPFLSLHLSLRHDDLRLRKRYPVPTHR